MTGRSPDTQNRLRTLRSSGSSQPRNNFSSRFRRVALLGAFAMFGAAAAIGMVQPSKDNSVQVQQRMLSETLPLALTNADEAATEADFVHETRIRSGDTLAQVLKRLHIDEPGLLAFLTHEPDARSIYRLYPGRSLQASLDENGQLNWLRYIHTPQTTENSQPVTALLEVRRADDGFSAKELKVTPERQVRVGMGEIRSSLFGATDRAGIPDGITQQIAEILGSRIDFLKDIRQGDQFRVVYEARMFEGRPVGSGRVLAVEFTNRGKQHSAAWYSPNGDERGNYYDFEGNSLRGAFLRTSLKFSRISSTFGMRQHPILNKWVGHKGVDYAAPSGTPIHATGDGTISFAGWQNGYGNVIIIEHAGGYSTLYAHQSRLAAGMTKGRRVSQGEQIGYVGATGWATGPHLHYEFRVQGVPVDPLSASLPITQKLTAAEVQAFARATAPYQSQIRMLAQFQQDMQDQQALQDDNSTQIASAN
ncbi:peptidoglycan DD-metalloendopeptidase family protein [Kerstersia similis]|uniref:M23 family metallopeptidase n=1 Tax=Kerstersia similis TaxID=206505 RepID=UPI0039EDFC90